MAPTTCPTCGGLRANIIDPSTLPTHPTDPRATVAANLGTLILNQLPYGSAIAFPPPAGTATTTTFVPIPPGYKAVNAVEMDGLYVENDAENPFTPSLPATNGDIADFDTMIGNGDLHYWEMKCSPHQVTKAMRIWYTYRQTYMDHGEERQRIVGTWLLIGYVGDGH